MFNTKQTNPAVRLAQKGDSISGVVVSVEYRPEMKWGSNGKKTDQQNTRKDGTPLDEAVITILPDGYSDQVTLYVPGSRWRMVQAIRDAVKDAGASNLEEGGHLTVIRDGEESNGGFTAATFSAQYNAA